MPNCLPAKAQVLEFKVGDTVMLGCQALDANGAPTPIVGMTVASEVRDEQGEIVCALEFVPITPETGVFELWAPVDVVWTAGNKVVDIQYVSTVAGRTLKRSTETFWLRMIQDITQA